MLEKMLALQNKRKKEGGFTLVELIVVLVILAILAALLIPALTGYIDKAREKSAIAETRQAVMAAQTIYDEKYGNGTSLKITADTWKDDWDASVKTLAELDGKGTLGTITVSKGKIATLEWTSSKISKKCTYNESNGTYSFDTTTQAGK